MEFETELEKELYDALKLLVDKYVCNMGTKNEFIACITPEGTPIYWIKAKAAVEMMESEHTQDDIKRKLKRKE